EGSIPPERGRWMFVLLAVVAAYLLYAAAYLLTQRFSPDRLERFPFVPWPPFARPVRIGPFDDEPEIPAPSGSRSDEVRPKRRPTQVRHSPPGSPPSADSTPASIQPLCLEVIEGPLRGQTISVSQSNFQVGAGRDNHLPIPSDQYLSTTHALFEVV